MRTTLRTWSFPLSPMSTKNERWRVATPFSTSVLTRE
eukprot:COSAG05_NODE_26074_length_191_cov_22.065217_1_plen_36_part_10